MWIYIWDTEIKWIYLWDTPVKEVYLWDAKIRPKARTFTISWTEQSNMSSGWTYSDDAAGLTAGSWDFDDFFWYSAVLLNTSGVETAEMTQSWWVFTGAMTTLGNITSGDNVMIKFPIRWIKMTKSWSVVTLSITEELNKTWYQYYAFQTWTLSNPWTAKDAFYLWAYRWYVQNSYLLSWSWKTPTWNVSQANFCTYAKNNSSNYNILCLYQRMYVNALYMMKYGNPNAQTVIWMWYNSWTGVVTTWWTNNQTSATYWTSSNTSQIKLFWLEDRWGATWEYIWGCYTDSNKLLYAMLSWRSWAMSWWESTWTTVAQTSSYYCLSSIAGTNKAMFAPIWTVSSGAVNQYYCDAAFIAWWTSLFSSWAGSWSAEWNRNWPFKWDQTLSPSSAYTYVWARLMYL